MDLKTGRAKTQAIRNLDRSVTSRVRTTSDTLGKDTRVIEVNLALGDLDDDTWYARSHGEKSSALGATLGTGDLPTFDFTAVSSVTYGDALISRKATIKDVQCAAIQQGNAGDRSLGIYIGYVPFTPGADIVADAMVLTRVGEADAAVETFTCTDSWTLSSKNLTSFNNQVIPANSILFIAIKHISGPTNSCGFQLKFDLEYKN
tara:strand:+ start:565 stop:1176 length:612 start_codon:yes stop_codon:yes gene_type:complete